MPKLNITDKIEIPEGVEIIIEAPMIKVKGPEGEMEKRLFHPMVKISKEEKELVFTLKNGTKREKMMMKTFEAHIKNMIQGSTQKYEYHLRVCSSHFPMTVTKESNKVIVKNFLGEKIAREARIMGDSEVEIKGTEISVKSPNIETAGQTAANIEKSTRLTNKDRRRFQDGIFITEKPSFKK
jgi:large subunit ribosomal protein L6